jgi:hypothetical protein
METARLSFPSGGREIMAIQMWAHGHSVQAENPSLAIIERFGWGAAINTNYGFHVGSVIAENHWVDFSIPTPAFQPGPQKITAVHLDFMTESTRAIVSAVNVWDGNNRIAIFDPIRLTGANPMATFAIPATPQVTRAIGVSVQISIPPDLPVGTGKIYFRAVGADFDAV